MDKTKIFESAGKYAAKGQNDKAAKEYQRILDEDPKDVRALQKLAEVCQKSGRMKEATDLSMRVADGYTEQGFFLKAVAVYKQLLKSGIDRIEVNQKLAQLYQQLGLMGDATQQYQFVANYFDQQGNIKESLSALRKMVELDPDNVASQVKLGELYAREQLIPEAVAELRKAAVYLKRNNRNEDYFRVLERIGQLAPDDVEAARELAQNYLAVADTKRALAKLQVCFRNDPKDIETLRLLARAFIDLGQEAKAVSVFRELAKVHQERNQAEELRQTLERIVELSPDDPEAIAALREMGARSAALPAVIAPPAPSTSGDRHRPAPPPLPPPATARQSRPFSADISPAVSKILTETDVYLKYGLIAKAAEHIKKALIEDSDSIDAQEKLLAIQDRQEKSEDALNTVVRIIELSQARGDLERVAEYTQDLAQRAPDHPLVREMASEAELPEAEIDPEAAFLEDEFLEGIPINTDPTIPPHMAAQFMPAPDLSGSPWERIVDEGEEQLVVVEASHGPARRRPTLDLGDEASLGAALDRATNPHAKRRQQAAEIDPFAMAVDADDSAVVQDDSIPHVPSGVEADTIGQPYEESAHGLLSAGLDAPESLPADAPETPAEAEYQLAVDDEQGHAAAGEEVVAEQAFAPADDPSVAEEQPVYEEQPASFFEEVAAAPADGEEAPPFEQAVDSPPVEDDFAEEYAEAEFLIQQGLPEDARGVLEGILLAAPEHASALALLEQLNADTPPAEQGAFEAVPESVHLSDQHVDLARELAEELNEGGTAAYAAPSEGNHSVEGDLAEFKKHLSVTVSAEDSQTHYDLGMAYKEMGLYDEAIHEFEVSLEGRGRRRVIDCLNMLGILRLEKGDPRAALVHFEQALKTPGLTLEASKEAHFEIGHCHELLGEEREAYDHYARVFKADQAFRDVKLRVARLRERLGARSSVHAAVGAANGSPPPAGGAAPAPSAAEPPAENTVPRVGRGKIGYI